MIALGVILIALLVFRATMWPRYVEGGDGVRDQWSGELCVFAVAGVAYCESGRVLSKRGGRWVKIAG